MSYRIRLLGIEIEGLGDLHLSALQLFDEALDRVDLDAILSCSHTPVVGALAHLQNDDPMQTCQFARADVLSPGFYIEYLFADVVQIGGIRLGLLAPATSPCRITIYAAGVPIWDINGIDVSAAGIGPLLERGDPFIDKVPTLLWSDGSGIRERSPSAVRTWVAQGAVSEVVSADAVDGRTFRFAETGSYLTTAGTPDLNLSGLNWTIELRVKTSKMGEIVLVDKYQGSGTWQLSLVDGLLKLYFEGYYALGSRNLADGKYHDILVARRGSELVAFVDADAPVITPFSRIFADGTTALSIGAQVASRSAAYDFVGDIDYVRLTNGEARVNEVFEPLRKIPLAGGGGGRLRRPRIGITATRSQVAVSSDVVQGAVQMHNYRALKLLDAEFGGRGRIYGTVSRKTTSANVSVVRRVRLHRSRDGYLARETWSKTDGTYEFKEIAGRYEYDVVAWDNEMSYRSVVANNLTPEAM